MNGNYEDINVYIKFPNDKEIYRLINISFRHSLSIDYESVDRSTRWGNHTCNDFEIVSANKHYYKKYKHIKQIDYLPGLRSFIKKLLPKEGLWLGILKRK